MQVLIVEDHGDSRQALKRCLTGHGYEVVATEDLQSGVDSLEKQRFDAIISDIGLPDGTGYELISRARQQGIRALAIAISGYPFPADANEAGVTGFNLHLSKPVDCEHLCSLLQQMLKPMSFDPKVAFC